MSPNTPVRIVGVEGTRRLASRYRHDWQAHAGRNPSAQGYFVKIRVAIVSTVLAILTIAAAHAQGVPGGAAHGFYEGNRRAGPVGAVVGGAVGGVIGGVEGVLGITPAYGTYSEPPPRVFYHRKRVKHSYRRIRHRQAAR